MIFLFPYGMNWNQTVHVFQVRSWKGESVESQEMKPLWLLFGNLPFDRMWSDASFWIPKIL